MNARPALEERARLTAAGATRERLLWGLPVAERRVRLAGIPTAVLEGGDGPPIVLLHGPGEFAATWMRIIPPLAGTHRVIAPDLPGHGASGIPEGPLDVDTMLDWLGELIELTCASPPVLVGRVWGAALATRFACVRPDRVARLVLVDATGLAPFRPSLRFALAMAGFIARPNERSQERLFRGCFTDLDGVRRELGEQWEPLASYALDRARTAEQQTALRRLLPHFGLPTIPPEELERLEVPTALIWGRHDRQVRLRVAEDASERFGWPLHVIEDAADDAPVERPEAFLRALHRAIGTPSEQESVS